MASLWTPDGERRIDQGPSPVPDDRLDDPGEDGTEIDRAALEEEMAELERQLVDAPVADVIANHCYGLFQLAAIHLSQQPPRLDDARLAIDALGAIVEGLGERLGEQAASLSEGLAQIRLAFVQLSGAIAANNDDEPPSL